MIPAEFKTITLSLTRQDYINGSSWVFLHRLRTSKLVCLLLLVVSFGVAAYFQFQFGNGLLALLGMICLIAVEIAFILLITRIKCGRLYSRISEAFQNISYTLDDAGIAYDKDGNHLHHPWMLFKSFWNSSKYLILTRVDVSGHVIPKRCFTSPAQLEAWVQHLDTHINHKGPSA